MAGALSEKYQKRREKSKENVINEFEQTQNSYQNNTKYKTTGIGFGRRKNSLTFWEKEEVDNSWTASMTLIQG